VAEWPLGNRAALTLSFDNLGEAAEVQLGATPMPEGPFGDHFTAKEVLPPLLGELRGRGLKATFFIEGVNARLYPDALATMHLQRHEVGYHAWCHEEWGELSAAEQADNLSRGLDAFRRLALDPVGMRPPGGQLGAGGTDVLAEGGLSYSSPAGAGTGIVDDFVLLPFQWRHVDASCVLPPLAAAREEMTGSRDQVEPDDFVAYLDSEIGRLVSEGGHMTIVLHLFMVSEWLGSKRLAALLDRVNLAAKHEGVWVAPGAKVAAHVLDNPEHFQGEAVLDTESWASDAG
jgi:peptidoglycan/xylan/chitin deacetylase (PgdA/CDA1 family)